MFAQQVQMWIPTQQVQSWKAHEQVRTMKHGPKLLNKGIYFFLRRNLSHS